MNENLDLTKILEGCPDGTEFYSSVFGTVRFIKITLFNTILMMTTTTYQSFAKDGRLYDGVGECTLFPSKDQRDWSKFVRFWDKPKVERFKFTTLKPFDKVLVRNSSRDGWRVDLFGHITGNHKCYCTNIWNMCVPYNDDTKHLLGTCVDCPDYYKWWEE